MITEEHDDLRLMKQNQERYNLELFRLISCANELSKDSKYAAIKIKVLTERVNELETKLEEQCLSTRL